MLIILLLVIGELRGHPCSPEVPPHSIRPSHLLPSSSLLGSSSLPPSVETRRGREGRRGKFRLSSTTSRHVPEQRTGLPRTPTTLPVLPRTSIPSAWSGMQVEDLGACGDPLRTLVGSRPNSPTAPGLNLRPTFRRGSEGGRERVKDLKE